MKSQIKLDDLPSGLKDSLALKYIAHYKGQFKNSLFLDTNSSKQNKIIYPSANSIALNLLSISFENEKIQYFLNTLPGSKGIVCMAQSQNKRYLAWCEQTDKCPIIFIVDLVNNFKKRTFASVEIKGNKYISLAFNGNQITDPKFLIALTNGPQNQLVQWNFQKGKHWIHTLQKIQKIDRVSPIEKFNQIFFYREEDTIVVMGKGNLKFYRISTQKIQLKDSPFARRQISERDFNFTSYAILKDGLIIGTDNGELLFFAINGQFKAILSSSPGENHSIETLLYLSNSSKAFLVGGSEGLLCLYEKSDSKETRNMYIRSERKFNLGEHKSNVISLVATPKEDEIFIGLHSGIILKMPLDKNEEQRYQYAVQSFHTDNITGLDVCLRKSLVATCSSDRTVRIWNYLQKNNLEVIKHFQQRPLNLSFHPSGLHLLVSFSQKVRLINVLENQLINYKDLSIKNCYEIKFSHGGHLFAVVNNVMAQIFNFYTLQQPSHYQFKAQAGKFQTMIWQEDDLAIYLGTSDGFVFYYKLEDPSVRLQILAVPGFSVRALACLFVGKDQKLGLINQRTVYIGGSFNPEITNENKCIYQVKITPKSQKDKERQSLKQQLSKYNILPPIKIYTNSNVSRILLSNSKKVFLYCTDEKDKAGTIRYSRYPHNLSKQVYEFQSHTTKISKFVVTFDDNYFFSVGGQGQFICYEFKDKESKSKVEMPDSLEEFLYSKQKLIGQKKLLQQLKERNFETKEKKDRVMRETKAENNRLLNEWNFKITERERAEKTKYDKQVEQISRMEKQQSKKLISIEVQHKQKRQTVQKDYSDKIQLQQTRFIELAKTKQSENKKFNDIVQTTINNHIKKKKNRQVEFEQELSKEQSEVKQYEIIYQNKKRQYETQQQKTQNQAQKEIKFKKQQNQIVVKDLQYQNNTAQSEKMAKQNQFQKQQKQLQQNKHKLKHTLQDIEKIKQKHQQNEQKKQSQAKQIQQRQKTIRDKMARINQLKKKTQELEKFKFVLDYKIKQLKRDIGPRQEEIAKMKEQIANMNAQIIHFRRTNDNMNLIVKDLVSKRGGMQKQIEELNRIDNSNSMYIKSFEYDVSDMYQNHLQEYKQLKLKIIEIFRKYVQEDNKKKIDGIDQQKQFIKERAHLQSTVKGLKEKFKKSIDLHEADNKRIMSQNEQLISQINDLKRQKKSIKDQSRRRDMMKENTEKLEEEQILIQKQFENTEKTLRQLKMQFERKVKRKREGLEV